MLFTAFKVPVFFEFPDIKAERYRHPCWVFIIAFANLDHAKLLLVSFLEGRGYRFLFQVKVKVGYTFRREDDKAPMGCANFWVIFQKLSGSEMVKCIVVFK